MTNANALWAPANDVIRLTGWSERTLRQRTPELRSKTVEGERRRGRARRVYDLYSIPADVLAPEKIRDYGLQLAHQSETTTIAPASRSDLRTAKAKQESLFAVAAPIGGERVIVPTKQEPEVKYRLKAITPLIEWLQGSKRPMFLDDDDTAFASSDQLAAWLGRHQEPAVSRGTIWKWYKRYRERGLAGLCREVRSDQGSSRRLSADAKKWLDAKYLGERLSITLCHESLEREWYARGWPGDAASYHAVRSYLQSLGKPFVVVGREGARGYNRKIEGYLERDFDSVRVNGVWVSDHRKYDVWVYNDCFPHERPMMALRVWHTMILDMRSRKAVGWAFCANPSSDSISSALHMAISQYGVPETFYVDNGKDYKKIGRRAEISNEASGLLVRLGVKLQYCIPAHPQSKLVESFFSGQSKRFDLIYGNSYAGRKPALRPEECDEQLRLHKAFLAHKQPWTPLGCASDFLVAAEQWIAEYNKKPHSGRGMNGKSPNEVYETACPERDRRLPDMEELSSLFWDQHQRKILRGGCVELYSERYEPMDQSSAAALHLAIGQDVLVRCDPSDLGQAVAYDMEGRLLGYLYAQKLVAHGPTAREDIRNSLRERRQVLKVLKAYIEFRSRGVPTERELLLRRAGSPPLLEGSVFPTQSASSPRALAAVAVAGNSACPPYIDDVVSRVRSLMKDQEEDA
jgi:transposase InsO family protein